MQPIILPSMEQQQTKMASERAHDFPCLDSALVRPMLQANNDACLLELRRLYSHTERHALLQIKQRIISRNTHMSADTFTESFEHIIKGSIVSGLYAA